MKTMLRSLLLGAALAAFTLSAAAIRDSGTRYAEKAMKAHVDSGALPGCISILYRDGVQETCCLGWADREKKIPMSLDSIFMQCSQTKGFCGVCMAILLEEGKVSLDDPVSKYLPFFKNFKVSVKGKDGKTTLVPAQREITIRMVMNHTSGLFVEVPTKMRHGWPSCSVQQSAIENSERPLIYQPGTSIRYSNTGIDVGAAVIEVVTGKRWEIFLQERVLDPLEMKNTTFWPTDEQLSRAIVLYQLSPDKPPRRIDEMRIMPSPHNGPRVFAAASAGLWTTAADQYKFYKMLMNRGVGDNGKRILKEETVKKYLETSTRPAGLGRYSMGLVATKVGENFGHGGALGTRCDVNADKKTLQLFVVQLFDGFKYGKEMADDWCRAADRFCNADSEKSGVSDYTYRTK